MKIKPNYIVIPLVVAVIAAIGSAFASSGLPMTDVDVSWYEMINKPSWVPPGWVFGVVWSTIIFLTAISLLVLWNNKSLRADGKKFRLAIILFIMNAALYISWTPVFFVFHMFAPAVLVASALAMNVWALILVSSKFSRIAAGLLLPYALWTTFATYMSYAIWNLN